MWILFAYLVSRYSMLYKNVYFYSLKMYTIGAGEKYILICDFFSHLIICYTFLTYSWLASVALFFFFFRRTLAMNWWKYQNVKEGLFFIEHIYQKNCVTTTTTKKKNTCTCRSRYRKDRILLSIFNTLLSNLSHMSIVDPGNGKITLFYVTTYPDTDVKVAISAINIQTHPAFSLSDQQTAGAGNRTRTGWMSGKRSCQFKGQKGIPCLVYKIRCTCASQVPRYMVRYKGTLL